MNIKTKEKFVLSEIENGYLLSLLSFLSKNKNLAIKILIPLLIFLLGYYSCSHSQRIVHKDIQDIFVISDEIRAFYSDKPDYWGLNTDFVIKNKVVSSDFIRRNNLLSSNGTALQIGKGDSAETIMPSTDTFDVILKNLTKAQCISYTEAKLSAEQLLKIENISIVNSKGSFTFEWGGKYKLPISDYATKDICQDKSNTIIWTLR